MIKCVNCPNPAAHTIAERAASVISYCPKCLPAHFRAGAAAGQFRLLHESQINKPQILQGVVGGNLEETAPAPTPKKKKKVVTAKPEAVKEPIAAEELEAAIADGYKAEATDGDFDGLVQDTTPFERPEGEVLVEYSEEPTEEV